MYTLEKNNTWGNLFQIIFVYFEEKARTYKKRYFNLNTQKVIKLI